MHTISTSEEAKKLGKDFFFLTKGSIRASSACFSLNLLLKPGIFLSVSPVFWTCMWKYLGSGWEGAGFLKSDPFACGCFHVRRGSHSHPGGDGGFLARERCQGRGLGAVGSPPPPTWLQDLMETWKWLPFSPSSARKQVMAVYYLQERITWISLMTFFDQKKWESTRLESRSSSFTSAPVCWAVSDAAPVPFHLPGLGPASSHFFSFRVLSLDSAAIP